jgi:hypothetical protein
VVIGAFLCPRTPATGSNKEYGEDDEPEQDRRFHVVGDSLLAVIGSARLVEVEEVVQERAPPLASIMVRRATVVVVMSTAVSIAVPIVVAVSLPVAAWIALTRSASWRFRG